MAEFILQGDTLGSGIELGGYPGFIGAFRATLSTPTGFHEYDCAGRGLGVTCLFSEGGDFFRNQRVTIQALAVGIGDWKVFGNG